MRGGWELSYNLHCLDACEDMLEENYYTVYKYQEGGITQVHKIVCEHLQKRVDTTGLPSVDNGTA